MDFETPLFEGSRFLRALGPDRAGQLIDRCDIFFSEHRDHDDLARLFAAFRASEHHTVATLREWMRDTTEPEVLSAYCDVAAEESRHAVLWTDRMRALVGDSEVARRYADPCGMPALSEHFRLWDSYATSCSLPTRLAYLSIVDAWSGIAYNSYLLWADSSTRETLEEILADEVAHVGLAESMIDRLVPDDDDRETMAIDEACIAGLLYEVTNGFLSSGI
ncbi:MAG: hypothetical protein M5T61_00990 [Acidimicrobiia bacterium]|nr:hypothetical protein [Acidimicrobiia bacterium]